MIYVNASAMVDGYSNGLTLPIAAQELGAESIALTSEHEEE